MKNKTLILFSIILLSFNANANNCGKLNISIANKTGHTCNLLSTYATGQIIAGKIPTSIANGEKANSLTIEQTYTSGPVMRLEYECDNKTVIISSYQGLCVFYQGFISGEISSTKNVSAFYSYTDGSWWNSIPGSISWTLN